MPPRTEILYIITRLDGGGAQRSVLDSVKHFQPSRKVSLAFGEGGLLDAYAKKTLTDFNVVYNLKQPVTFKNIFSDVKAFFELIKIIRSRRPAIVHTNCPKAGIIGRAAAFFSLTRPKIIHTYHGLGFSSYDGKFKYKMFALLERAAGFITDKLIFVSLSNMAEAHCLQIGNLEKNVLIRAGIAAPRRTKNPRLPEIPEGKTVVLSAGNFKKLKNAADFARLAKKVAQKNNNFVFLYAGAGGPEEETVKKLAGDSVLFLGFRKNLPDLLDMADFYVTTTLREGLSMSALEAWQAQKPVFAYKADGMEEIIAEGENGFLFNFGDTDAMAAALIKAREENFKVTKPFDKKEFSAAATHNAQQKLYASLKPRP